MHLISHLRKLTKYPPHITCHKILRKIFIEIKIRTESLKENLSSASISDEELLKSMLHSFDSADDLANHFRKRTFPDFFFGADKKNKLSDLVIAHYPESVKQVIADADRVCEHKFDLLGSGPVFLGDKINWHKDFKSDWTWEQRYHKLVSYRNLNEPYDVKVPWELSRFQHLVTLGKAYWYAGDEKYTKEFISQFSHWIALNPPRLGVNWACPMDVSIRIINLIWGFCFFRDSPVLDNRFIIDFIKNILIHGRHIINNLEDHFDFTSNHYLADIAGLVYLGVFFPEFKEAKQWFKFGTQEIIEEMKNQVYDDGVDFEGSIPYHRLVTELFLSVTILMLLNEKAQSLAPFPEWYMKRLERMFEFVLYYTKPNGAVPQVGDNDNGRLHILSNYGNWDILDHRYLLSIGAVLFNRSDFKIGAGEFHEEAFWLLGEDGLNKFASMDLLTSDLGSKAFPLSGFYIMRHDSLYMIVDCFSYDPQAPSGHRHNSILSFDMFAYDQSFIIDPGTYVYTADYKRRNVFRSTGYHNTAKIDGKEQNSFDPLKLFSLGNPQAKVTINKWESKDEFDFLDAEHDGYERLAEPTTHRRQIFFNKIDGYWVIRDIITTPDGAPSIKKHAVEILFHLPSIF